MRKTMFVVPVALSAAGVLVLAVPASAVDSPVTLEVTAGALAVSAPTDPVSLGTAAASLAGLSVAGELGDVTVTDDRGGETGWTVAVNATAVTGPTAGGAISYDAPAAEVTGTATVTPEAAADLLVSSNVQTATAVSGVNSAVWSPTITVTLPANALAGTYSSTVTHSVS